MIIRDFSLEIVREIEIGINNFLKKSIIYSPFSLFFKLFKKSYPQLIHDIRHYISQDIEHIIKNHENFNMDDISDRNYDLSIKGERLLASFEKLGSDIFKKHLSVRKSFNLISKSEFRHEFYEILLSEVKTIIDNYN
ncbi:hypothetical protein N8772_02695 [Rickettsiales bacterium]|nr:hypothetical protein [Rickettsiales bacterium]MDB2550825.1 hypothetical protein [Rickettsiales bacterium]